MGIHSGLLQGSPHPILLSSASAENSDLGLPWHVTVADTVVCPRLFRRLFRLLPSCSRPAISIVSQALVITAPTAVWSRPNDSVTARRKAPAMPRPATNTCRGRSRRPRTSACASSPRPDASTSASERKPTASWRFVLPPTSWRGPVTTCSKTKHRSTPNGCLGKLWRPG